MKYSEAQHYFKLAVTLDEQNPEYIFSYSCSLLDNSNYREAIQQINVALQIFSNIKSSGSELAECYNTLGGIYKLLGQYDKAIEFHQKALDIDIRIVGEIHPNIAIYYNNMHLFTKKKNTLTKQLNF